MGSSYGWEDNSLCGKMAEIAEQKWNRMNCMSVWSAQKMGNFDEIKKNISRFKKKLFKISCFLLFPDKSSKKGSKWKMNTTFTNKKTAATPTFCKRNFIQTFQIWEMNFLFKVALTCTTAGHWHFELLDIPPDNKNFFECRNEISLTES